MQYNYLVTVHNLPCLLVVLMMNHRTQTISQTCICFSMQCRPTDRLQSKQSIFANKGYLSLTTTTTQNLIESEDQTRPRRRRRRRINKRFEGD